MALVEKEPISETAHECGECHQWVHPQYFGTALFKIITEEDLQWFRGTLGRIDSVEIYYGNAGWNSFWYKNP